MLSKYKHILLIMVIITFTFSACQKLTDRDDSSSPAQGGTLYWGTINKPTIINPILTTHSVSMSLIDVIFNRLVRVNSEGEVEPDLAKSWDVSKNGLVYTFYLREGVYFHDGVECTSEDVLFTYKRLIDPAGGSPVSSHFSLVDSVEAVDKYTFRMTLKKPFPRFLKKLVRAIVPKHVLQGQDLRKTPFNYQPIGTGPFQFKSWDRETDEIELIANENYFEGRPHLDRIIVKTYWDISRLWSGLMRREIDMAIYINHKDYLIAKEDSSFKTYVMPWEVYSAIVYNLKDSILSDKAVRKAIAHGIDRQRIMELTGMNGVESTGPFHPDSIGFNQNVSPFKYDPVKAEKILSEIGWADKNGDGVREKRGQELEIRLLVDSQVDLYKTMVMAIRQQLAEIGVRVSVQLYEDEAELTEGYLQEKRSQAWLRFLSGQRVGGYESSRDWYSLSSEFGKLWSYKNDKVDAIFELARSSKDETKREASYKQIHKIIYEDQPVCFLFFPVSYHAVSSRFENTNELFDNNHMPAYTIKDWYVAN